MKKIIQKRNKARFFRECKKFVRKQPKIYDIDSFVEAKCRLYFPNCDDSFKYMASDFVLCLNNLNYSRIDFLDALKCYEKNETKRKEIQRG